MSQTPLHSNDAHELSYANEPVCPWCGGVMSDAWELDTKVEESTHTCGHCDKEYNIAIHVEVTYSTSLTDEQLAAVSPAATPNHNTPESEQSHE